MSPSTRYKTPDLHSGISLHISFKNESKKSPDFLTMADQANTRGLKGVGLRINTEREARK